MGLCITPMACYTREHGFWHVSHGMLVIITNYQAIDHEMNKQLREL